MDEKIRSYFELGLTYREILAHLAIVDDINISHITLKRHLKRLNLYRRKYDETDIEALVSFLEEEMQSSGCLPGYKWMHLRLVKD